MKDRTSIIISLLLHVGLISFFLMSPHARFRMPQGGGGFVSVPIINNPAPSQPQVAQAQPPKPEPPQLEPKLEIKPEKEKPKLSDDLIRSLQDKLKRTPTKKPEPTRSPQPTPRQAAKPTPSRTPQPTRTPIPTLPNMIPLEQMDKTPSMIAQAGPTPTPGYSGITPGVGIPGPAGANAGGIGTGGNGMGGLEIAGEGGYDFSSYGYAISLSLRKNWRPPTNRPPEKKDYTAVVSFFISKDGSVSNIQIVESSGWLYLDQTVKEAVERSSRFESLPLTYTSGSVQVKVRFVLPQK